MAAAGRAGRGAAGDPRLRRGAPRPQARQRAAGHRRAAGDRLRHLPRRRRDRADGGRGGVRHARLHVTRAGRGPAAPGPRATCSRWAAWSATRRRGRDRSAPGRRPPSCTGSCTPSPSWTGCRPRLREIVAGCLAKDPAARPTPRALSAMIAGRDAGHRAVRGGVLAVLGGRLIGAYQARLEQETRAGPAEGFSWAARHAPADHAVGPGARPAGVAGPGAAGAAAPVRPLPGSSRGAALARTPGRGAGAGAARVPGSQAHRLSQRGYGASQYPEPQRLRARARRRRRAVPQRAGRLPAAAPVGRAPRRRCPPACSPRSG